MALPARAPSSGRPGIQPGNFSFYGDSLSAVGASQSALLQYISPWWKWQAIPRKASTASGDAVFGWKLNPNGLNAGNIAVLNATFDGTAPWNAVGVWLGTNDIAGGDSGATVFANLQTLDATLALTWPARFYATMLARGGLTAGQLTERTNLNNALIATPIGTGTINLNAYPGAAGSGAPWFVDLVHIPNQGHGWCAANAWDPAVKAWLATL